MLLDYLEKEYLENVPEDTHTITICWLTTGNPMDRFSCSTYKHVSTVEIFFCTGGELTVHHTSTEKTVVKKKEIAVLARREGQFSFEASRDLQGILVVIDGEQTSQSFAPFSLDTKQLTQYIDTQKGNVMILCNTWTQTLFHTMDKLCGASCREFCLLKAMELLYILPVTDCVYNTQNSAQIPTCITLARTYMEDHLSEKITIKNLCHMLSVSPTYLKAEFRRVYGVSVHRWLTDLRMQRAGELIYSSDQPIYQVALSVGYESISQFHTVFKKYHGITPGQLKKMSKTESYCPFQ